MPEMKFEQKEDLSRKEAAARLSAIAKALASDDKFELERGGEKLELRVPDQVRFELEIEIKDDETELEVEIKWSSATASTPSKRSTARRPPKRSTAGRTSRRTKKR